MRSFRFTSALVAALLALPGVPVFPADLAAAVKAAGIATELSRLGPRPPGSAAHEAAFNFLGTALRRAGLTDVTTIAAASPGRPLRSLSGRLPGSQPDEIVLSAHYDTVPGSPGAGDDASGCATILAAIADLRRTPLQHSVRVLLLDGEEDGSLGSRAWIASRSAGERERILAAVNLEMVGWAGSAGPVVLSFPVRHPAGGTGGAGAARMLAPGWLVHALLGSGGPAGWKLAFAAQGWSLPAQLLLRTTTSRYGADSDAFVAAGIPAATLSDSSPWHLDPAYHGAGDTAERLAPARLERWATTTAAAVRRLDHLPGRPVAEDSYLVVFGRVWLRRDLYWVGGLLWGLLVLRSRPRGPRTPAERRERQREAFPGFVLRMLFLLTVLFVPVHAILLYPAVLLAQMPPRTPVRRRLWIGIGLAPLALMILAILLAWGRGMISGYALGPLDTALPLATLAAWVIFCLDEKTVTPYRLPAAS